MTATMTAAELDIMILVALAGYNNPKDRNQLAGVIAGADPKRVGQRLAALCKRGSVIQIAGGRGSRPATYVVNRSA